MLCIYHGTENEVNGNSGLLNKYFYLFIFFILKILKKKQIVKTHVWFFVLSECAYNEMKFHAER